MIRSRFSGISASFPRRKCWKGGGYARKTRSDHLFFTLSDNACSAPEAGSDERFNVQPPEADHQGLPGPAIHLAVAPYLYAFFPRVFGRLSRTSLRTASVTVLLPLRLGIKPG